MADFVPVFSELRGIMLAAAKDNPVAKDAPAPAKDAPATK